MAKKKLVKTASVTPTTFNLPKFTPCPDSAPLTERRKWISAAARYLVDHIPQWRKGLADHASFSASLIRGNGNRPFFDVEPPALRDSRLSARLLDEQLINGVELSQLLWREVLRTMPELKHKLPALNRGLHRTLLRGEDDAELIAELKYLDVEAQGDATPAKKARPTNDKPLIGRARKAADIIIGEPGLPGKDIAGKLKVNHDVFRRIFSKELAPRGFTNARDGTGYHPPASV